LSCRFNALICVSSRKSVGKLFHTRGPATEKLLSYSTCDNEERYGIKIFEECLGM